MKPKWKYIKSYNFQICKKRDNTDTILMITK